MKVRKSSILIVSVALVAAVLVPSGPSAVVQRYAYGSKLDVGGAEFVPTLWVDPANPAAPNVALSSANVKEIDLTPAGNIANNCFYYSPGSGALETGDVRLSPCEVSPGNVKAAGTVVAAGDNFERAQTPVASGFGSVVYADANDNGRHDAGDPVYLTTGAANNLAASSSGSTTVWSLRLTAAGDRPAGTLVRPNDADYVDHHASVQGFPTGSGISFFDADASASFGAGDTLYLVRGPKPTSALVPHLSVRLSGPTGPFGSQARLGDADFVPTAAGTVTVFTSTNVRMIDFDAPNVVTDNCLYYSPGGIGQLAAGDIRLTACKGAPAGSLVTTADQAERSAVSAASGFNKVVYGDVNLDNAYDAGDYVYLTTATAGLASSTTNNQWTLRLTPATNAAAGTFVVAQDADFAAHSANAKAFPANSGVGYFDADYSVTQTAPDSVYLSRGPTSPGSLIPFHSLRLAATSGAFGTQLGLYHADALPVASNATLALDTSRVKQVEGGATGLPGNCFYYSPKAGNISVGDVRLSPCGNKLTGSRVATGESDVNAVPISWPSGFSINVLYADVNGDQRYDAPDYVYISTGVPNSLPASTSTTAWSLRMTATPNHQAGTLVQTNDADRVQHASGTGLLPLGSGMVYFDADSSGSLSAADSLFLSNGETPVGRPMRLFSLRVYGPVVDPAPATPPTTSSTTSTSATGGVTTATVTRTLTQNVTRTHVQNFTATVTVSANETIFVTTEVSVTTADNGTGNTTVPAKEGKKSPGPAFPLAVLLVAASAVLLCRRRWT